MKYDDHIDAPPETWAEQVPPALPENATLWYMSRVDGPTNWDHGCDVEDMPFIVEVK